ncbi:MinD/ParA family protein [Niveibacterium sp.]|uniref:MinD/ParA family ATP-binding protein n=1 Tax=Niveibacterium sp. TaxID=2017444 RepID=UPI0035AE6C88
MKPGFEDQAAGLRRLLRRAPPQVVAVSAFGAGAMHWLAGQALTRAQGGRQVTVFDEMASCGNLADALGAAARFDLLQAVERHVSLDAARVEAGPGLSLYSSARLARALNGADRVLSERFADTCRALQRGCDLWLIHARPDERRSLSPLASAAHRMVVVVDGSPRAITEAYAMIKQLDGGPWPQIDLALANPRDQDEAEALLANLILVGHRQTNLALRRVKGLDACAAAAAAASDSTTDSVFLDRVLGLARRRQRASMALAL